MKKIIYSSLLALIGFSAQAQCFEIESILVDACTPGSLSCSNVAVATCNCEGKNEMVRFKIGAAPLAANTLTVNWPNNSWLGLSPVTATTTGIVNALNSTIVGCGWLVEPVAGVLRANSRVLMITSTDFCASGNSFANLNDTMTIIFQNPGNFSGHFANYTPAVSLRTLLMNFTTTPGCTDAVTYDRSLLVNQSGGFGGSSSANDGSSVEFSPLGVATYSNYGCQAPFVNLSVNAGLPSQTVCAGNSIALTATVNGVFNSVTWSGGAGSFSPTNSLTTSYTPATSESGTIVKLYVTVMNTCSTKTITTKDSVLITNLQVASTPTLNATNGYSLCPLASTILSYSISNTTATGGVTSGWSTPAAATNTYAVSAPIGTAPITYSLTVTNVCGVSTQTVNIYPLALPTVSLAAQTLTACAGNTVAVMATSNSGNYNWNNPIGATTASVILTANTSTTGVVSTTNTCGTANQNYTLSVTQQPTVTVSNTNVSLCTGQSATVTANANTAATYTWSGTGVNGLNTNTVVLNTAGTYTVNGSNACNTSSALVTVVINSTPTLSVTTTNSLLCSGSTATLTTSGSAGTYSWSNGAGNTPTISVNTSGTYVATITTSSCGSATASITVNAALTPSLSVNSNSVTICAGQSATLIATSNIANYNWSNLATTNSIVVNTAGTYTVGSTNACGTSTQTINVGLSSVPTLSVATTNTILCNGSTAQLSLSGSAGSYSWSTGATGTPLTINAGGTYIATVTTIGCGTASTSITIAGLQSPTITVVSNTAIVCNNTPIILTANSNINTYTWSPLAANTNTLQVLSPTVYNVTSTNACGTSVQSITVTTGSSPNVFITPTNTIICAGNTVSLTANSTVNNYNWLGVTSTNSIVSVGAGSYTVTSTNACGTSSAVIVVNSSLIAAGLSGAPLTGTSPLSVAITDNAQAATSYTWNYGNGTSSTGSNPITPTYTAAGTYTITQTVSNSAGCLDSQILIVVVKFDDAIFIIPNVFTPNNDSINDVFKVSATNIKDFNCVIFDRWGLQMYSWSDINKGWDGRINSNLVTDGTYFFIINATDLNDKEIKKQGAFSVFR